MPTLPTSCICMLSEEMWPERDTFLVFIHIFHFLLITRGKEKLESKEMFFHDSLYTKQYTQFGHTSSCFGNNIILRLKKMNSSLNQSLHSASDGLMK